MYDQLARAAGLVDEVLAGLRPEALAPEAADRLMKDAAGVERKAAAVKALCAARVKETEAWRGSGAHSAGEHVADAMGTSRVEAERLLKTVEQLQELPEAAAAFMDGALSEAQAQVVAGAGAVDPSAAASLIETALRGNMKRLRDHARRVREQAVVDPEERHRSQVRAREFRHWVDEDGMVSGRFRLAPEVGTPLVNRIEAETDRQYRTAYREGRREERVAYAADAFVSLMSGAGKGAAGRADLVVVVDLDAYGRGHTHDGERCHIPGVGRLPVCVAKEIGANAFLKGVVIDGTEITKVRHFGRHIPAEVRTALELGKPPELDGRVCDVCGTRMGCQFDHLEPRANGGPTSIDNLHPLCRPDHGDKTEHDRSAGKLTGEGLQIALAEAVAACDPDDEIGRTRRRRAG